MEPVYKRILLKLSGEALAAGKGFGLNFDTVQKICEAVKKVTDLGVEVAIVVGGGNFCRGREGGQMDRAKADHMGMLATAINSLALSDTLSQLGVDARVQTAIQMKEVAEPYIRDKAINHLQKGRVVIFGCGLGEPYFTTDTAAALRAVEIGADIIFKATNVDGVYSSDPKKDPNAVKYDELSFIEVLNKGLNVMDSTAASLCMDNSLPILVFNLSNPENIVNAVMGKNNGTIVK